MSKFVMGSDSYLVTPLFVLLLIGGIIGVATFLFLLRFRKKTGVDYWLVWQLAAAVWAFAYAFEFAATDLETKIMWSKISYFGIVYGPVSFLLFSLAFSSNYKLLKKKYVVLLYVFASLFILSPFTNDLHHLHWKNIGINPETNATGYVYGPLFWVMTVFAYIALLGGIINIFLLYFRLPDYYKRQITLLLIASLLPPVGNLIYVFHINPLPGFDWTPLTFLLTGILIAVNISQFGMFELVPFARNMLIDIIPDAILIVDKSSRIADCNPALKRLVGSDKELIGEMTSRVLPDYEGLIRELIQYEEFQSEISVEIDGKERYFELQSTVLYNQRKQENGRLIVMKDITNHILAEEKTKDANLLLTREIEEKEKLIVDLDAFSHTVAHDLKNMLGAIVSASNLIKIGVDDMQKEELLEINELISQAATKTMHITRELLTLASVRQEEIRQARVNMQKVVKDSLSRLKDVLDDANATVITPESWPDVWGYEAWLEEVWTNYISNAVKYGGTPPRVELGCEVLQEKGAARFWIKDNGKGLSDVDMALLFNKFTRLDVLRAEGNGLGLSIVKRIIEKLNGEVGVESKNIPGEGSTFYFILPLVQT